MNIDVSSIFPYGAAGALRQFMLDHTMAHNQESAALTTKFGGVYSTFGLQDELAEDGWIRLMETRKGPTPDALNNWLTLHYQIHNQTYQRINGVGSTAPDLSQVDFSNPEQFYLWMQVHQEMHDYEQSILGVK